MVGRDMMAEFDRVFREAVRKTADDFNSKLEEMCEKSLVDSDKRGILVLYSEVPFRRTITLESRVPWGHIYYVREGTENYVLGTLPSSEEGGRGA